MSDTFVVLASTKGLWHADRMQGLGRAAVFHPETHRGSGLPARSASSSNRFAVLCPRVASAIRHDAWAKLVVARLLYAAISTGAPSDRHYFVPSLCFPGAHPLLGKRNLWASPSPSKPSRPAFFPARYHPTRQVARDPGYAGSSRPLRCKKAVRSGPPLRCGPLGSRAPDAPKTVRYRRGWSPARATRR